MHRFANFTRSRHHFVCTRDCAVDPGARLRAGTGPDDYICHGLVHHNASDNYDDASAYYDDGSAYHNHHDDQYHHNHNDDYDDYDDDSDDDNDPTSATCDDRAAEHDHLDHRDDGRLFYVDDCTFNNFDNHEHDHDLASADGNDT